MRHLNLAHMWAKCPRVDPRVPHVGKCGDELSGGPIYDSYSCLFVVDILIVIGRIFEMYMIDFVLQLPKTNVKHSNKTNDVRKLATASIPPRTSETTQVKLPKRQ